MGILTANKKTISDADRRSEDTTLADTVRTDPRDVAPTRAGSAGSEATPTDLFSILPSPPAPCQTCGMAILWLPTTLDAWRCPTCFPPPIRKMVAARVVLVDVDSEFGISPQWFKLAWVERDGRRSLITTPIECAANGTALVDAVGVSGVGGRDEAKNFSSGGSDALGAKLGALNAVRDFVIDDRLGPYLVDGDRLSDDEWWAIGSSEVVWKQFFDAKGI